MSKYSASVKKPKTVSYGSGGSSGSSSSKKPIDYSSIGGSSSGSSSSSSSSSSSNASNNSAQNSYYVSNPTNTMMSTGTPTSPGKVAANSYESGKVTIEKDEYGGEYMYSPSGKVSYKDKDGNVTVLKSTNKETVGQTFYADGTSTMDKPVETVDPNAKYSYTYKGEYDDVGTDHYSMQVDALQSAMKNSKKALQSAYDESEQTLNDAIAEAQRQAYVNQQRAVRAMPQMMAAAGYSGGVTESNAANIMNEYQNALTDLERSKAQELARLQANLANGIAETDTQYNIQLANALQAAQAYEAQKKAQDAQLELQERAMKLSEDKFLAEQDDKDKPKTYSASEVINMVKSGLMSANEGRRLLGLQGGAPEYSGAIDRMINGYYEGLNEIDFENLMAYYIREGRISPNELQAWLRNNGR